MFVQVIRGQVTDPEQVQAALDRWSLQLAPGAPGCLPLVRFSLPLLVHSCRRAFWAWRWASVSPEGALEELPEWRLAASLSSATLHGSRSESRSWADSTSETGMGGLSMRATEGE